MDDADYKLLELAAKAAGELYTERAPEGGLYLSNGQDWNPLEDDGDALRLAVKVGIRPDWGGFDVEICRTSSGARNFCYVEPHGADPYAATRRAIVKAAAKIGRVM